MNQQPHRIKAVLYKPKKPIIIAGLAVLAAVLLVFSIVNFVVPKRSVASFCSTFRDEKARLTKLPGNTYPSGVFNETLSDAGEFAVSYGKLEKVAPDEIKADVATLQSLYKKINEDPSQSIAAAISGVAVDESVKSWTTDHCKE